MSGDTQRKLRELWDRRDELAPEHRAQLEAIVRRGAEMVCEADAIVTRYAAAGADAAEKHANRSAER